MEFSFKEHFDIVYLNCLEAAEQLGFEIDKENISTNTLTYNTPASIFSWGELLQIDISEIENSLIRVNVTSKAKKQIFTWGKNRDNENRFFMTLNGLFES